MKTTLILATIFASSATLADYNADIRKALNDGFAYGEKCIELVRQQNDTYLLRINYAALVREGLFKPTADWDIEKTPYEMTATPTSQAVKASIKPHPKADKISLLCYGKPVLVEVHNATAPVKWRHGLMASVVSYTSKFELASWANNPNLRDITPEWDLAFERTTPTKQVEKFVRTDLGWLRWETYRKMEK